ncbi:MAG: pyrimidine/purine nucleoside phosphorylase [Pseudomonadales bacterium]|nr:pyrimidine/purine nucleoside phosphorylase [Pseudomonadales bacterium]
MFDVNQYFEGRVTSIAFQTATLPATIGVMKPGEYTFDTNAIETMTIVSGALVVQLPDSHEWQTFNVGDDFVVAADKAFNLKVTEETAYLCTYG